MTEREFLIQTGKNIKGIRTQAGITQSELADLCCFDRGNMSRIEAGQVNMTVNTVYKICTALGVPPHVLFR
jgi:transcriptional regulator with XRE-family HTH domain